MTDENLKRALEIKQSIEALAGERDAWGGASAKRPLKVMVGDRVMREIAQKDLDSLEQNSIVDINTRIAALQAEFDAL